MHLRDALQVLVLEKLAVAASKVLSELQQHLLHNPDAAVLEAVAMLLNCLHSCLAAQFVGGMVSCSSDKLPDTAARLQLARQLTQAGGRSVCCCFLPAISAQSPWINMKNIS